MRIPVVHIDDTDGFSPSHDGNREECLIRIFHQTRDRFESCVIGRFRGQRDGRLVLGHPSRDSFAQLHPKIAPARMRNLGRRAERNRPWPIPAGRRCRHRRRRLARSASRSDPAFHPPTDRSWRSGLCAGAGKHLWSRVGCPPGAYPSVRPGKLRDPIKTFYALNCFYPPNCSARSIHRALRYARTSADGR